MTPNDVASYLNCHYVTVYRLIHRGGLPVFRLGSDFRIQRADLENWITQQHVVANAKKPARRPRGR
jgi:excisionase family DNA binding protein